MLGFYAAYNYAEGNFITWANTKKLDDRRIVSLGLSGAAGKKISLNLEVKNALDEHVMDMRGFPLEGRAYYITARTAF
jgi:outer membrane receptor for ferrienterochelin and colicin